MENSKKIEMLEEIFELEPGIINEDTVLEELEQWDSMSKLSLIVLADDEFGKKLSGAEIKSFVTISDVLKYLG